MSCVVDTSLLIYFLAEAADATVLRRIEQAFRAEARISVITRTEVLGWRGHTDESRARARFLLDQLDEIALTSAVVERVIERCVPPSPSSCRTQSSPPVPYLKVCR
jgi:predicted nucleic acid-binding protein